MNPALSIGAFGDDAAGLHERLQTHGYQVSSEEIHRRFFGPGTRAALQQFQTDHDLPPSGVVDEATGAALAALPVGPAGGPSIISVADRPIGAIGNIRPPGPQPNGGSGGLPGEPPGGPPGGGKRIVSGKVTDRDGLPLPAATVVAFDCDLRTRRELGRAQTDSRGDYRIEYGSKNLLPDSPAADLKIDVRDDQRGTTLLTSPILFNAPPQATINAALGGARRDAPSELSALAQAVSPLLGDLDPAALAENSQYQDLSFLNGETGIPEVRLAFWTIAARLAHATELPAELFYALLRGNVPTDGQMVALARSSQGVDLDGNAERLKEAILATSAAARSAAVDQAVAGNVVPASYAERSKDDLARLGQLASQATLSTPKFFGKTSLGSVLDLVSIKPGLQAEFGQLYSSAAGAARRMFWTDLAKNPSFTPGQVADLHFGVTVGRLTRGHVPLITELVAQRKAGTISHARDLARLTADDWLALLQKPVNGTPIGIPAGFSQLTGELGAQRYAATLERNFTSTYPTPAFSARLARDPKPAFALSGQLASFLDVNPSFDLRLTNVDSFTKTAPIDQQLRAPLLAAQRLVKLNSNYSVMSALMADGLHSAQQVYMMGRDRFVATYGQIAALGPTEAARTFAKAEQTYGVALAVATRFNAALSASSPAAVGDMLPADTADQIAGFPNLQTLFGSDSVCSCSDCQSVLGAPAYLVDMLEFLKHRQASNGRSIRDVLLARRPDLRQIELSCPNTNTALPYIDLVNELLEEAVSPPDPPPAPPASRKRQTTLTTAELDANPEYVNDAAYTRLAGAVYPWTLPFDLPLAEARAYLGQLALDRVRLVKLFQRPAGYPSAQARQIAVETLGFTALAADIVTGGALAAGTQPWDYWGLAQTANAIVDPRDPTKTVSGDWITVLTQVRVLLARAGLSYRELTRLLNTEFVNPDGSVQIVSNPPDSCDVSTMTIAWGAGQTGGTPDAATSPAGVLERIHRFVRLWRQLCWDAYDLDDAINVLQHHNNPGVPRLNDELLRQLAVVSTLVNRYAFTVREAVAMFCFTPAAPGPVFAAIPTRAVPKLPGDDLRYSLYHDLFQNLTVISPLPSPDTFDLNGAGTEIAATPPPGLAANAARIAAGLGVTDTDLGIAIGAFTDANLTLANLSAIYRNLRLASLLGVTVQQLITLLALAEAPIDPAPGYEPIAPFDATRPESMLTFIDAVQTIRASGLSIEQLDWILRDVAEPGSGVAPEAVAVGTWLLALRNGLAKITQQTTPAPDPTGALIRKQLTKLLAAADVQIAFAILDGSSTLSAADQGTFIATKLGGCLDPAAAQANLIGAGALPAGEQRFDYLLAQLLAYERRNVATHLIVQSLAQQLGLATATAALLLGSWFPSTAPGGHAIDNFLALGGLPLADPTQPIPAGDPNYTTYFTLFTVLAKTALIITSLKLSAEDVERWQAAGTQLGWLDPTALPSSPSATAGGRFRGWSRLVSAREVRDAITAPGSFFQTLFAAADPPATKQAYLDQLTKLTGWPLDAVTALCGDPANAAETGVLSLRYPDDYRSETALARLIPAMNAVTSKGIPSDPSGWLGATVTPARADEIKQTVKARYSTGTWLTLAKQLRDPLRQRQRDALVAYLLAGAPLPGARQWLDPEDVYAHFLIDVEMCACQATSRIVQANAAVQLFVQRCFLNLESPDVTVDVSADGDWAQWQWMSQYRLWQANREVFLFPENWIDPSLRKTKSPFFAELEQQLKQGDLTKDAAETALMNYLEKLEAVARLDVCGEYYDAVNKKLYVVARTQGVPPIYYIRRWENSAVWTAWEKVDLDISSDHVLPVVWHNKLYLFWAITTTKPDQNQPTAPAVPQKTYDPVPTRMHMEVQLAWSQYKQNKWQPKQTAPQTLAFSGLGASSEITLKSLFDDAVLQINVFLVMDPGDRMQGGAFRLGGAGTGVEAFVADPTSLDTIGGQGVAEVGALQPPLANDATAPGSSDFDGDWVMPDVTVNQSYLPSLRRVSTMTTTYDSYGSLKPEVVLEQADYYRLITPHQTPTFDSSLPFFYRDTAREYFIVPTVYYQQGSRFVTTAPQSVYQPAFKYEYRFWPFYHAFVPLFISQLNFGGIDALYAYDLQLFPDKLAARPPFDFKSYYQPTDNVLTLADGSYPAEDVDFEPEAGYALYNWELFYHVPFLVGKGLATNRRFDLAKRWYEHVFDPAGPAVLSKDGTAAGIPQKFWITKPFHQMQAPDYQAQQLAALMQAINSHDTTLDQQVAAWRSDPYDPDMIAQLRPVAYQRAIVMRYIDNLIGWGDQLFRQDTMESINLATQLYVLAAELLGPRPEIVPPRVEPVVETYADLDGKLDDFSNAVVAAENVIRPVTSVVITQEGTPKLPTLSTLYFRIPPNTQLLGYWDTVADRLFKIRHCMNIEGVVQQLPLFAPPISPGLLVAAAAAGLDLASVLSDTGAALPPYRFTTMIRTAIELCEMVRGLGSELLAALEKSDAEQLSTIRSSAEVNLQAAITDVRAREIDAANQSVDALQKARKAFVDRQAFYAGRHLMNTWEEVALVLQGTSLIAEAEAGILEIAAGAATAFPQFTAGAAGFGGSPLVTVTEGGENVGGAADKAAKALRIAGAALQTGAQMSSTLGSYHQRQDAWQLEGTVAGDEIARIDSETLAAQIRQDVAVKQQAAQSISVQEANAVDQFLRTKYTNQELYDWMVAETSTTYFQAYQLAYVTARQAEECFRRELAISDDSRYIQFGYWDSLRNGLTAGDKLLYDLRRLESAYFNQNARELELTKHVSLLQLDPYALVELRNNHTCVVTLPELLYDLDNPGHYLRRLKNVSVSVPCVVGPYGGVSMTLTLIDSKTRTQPDTSMLASDPPAGITQVVTSSAQNDAGAFELRLEDERYLPFEGSGAISTWQLTLNNVYPQFDYSTITDVVLHLRYTARYGGDGFRDTTAGQVRQHLNDYALAQSRKGLYRLFSARHEYATNWAKFLNPPADTDQTLTIETPPERFQFFTAGMDLKITGIDVIAPTTDTNPWTIQITPPGRPTPLTPTADTSFNQAQHWAAQGTSFAPPVDLGRAPTPAAATPPQWTIKLKKADAADFRSLTQADLADLILIVAYQAMP